ncbi:MAG: 16S rRNA (cytosine(967)-C(5))-methyltransferase [Nitrospinota bacterium]|nr:MAG: 16S rRNA (cytosine(967)-C(5))-methyltransferase [Nitrospinota bacterium]
MRMRAMAPQQKASESRERGARTLALALLLDRERKRIPLDRLLHRVQDQASLAPAERALLHELVYGVYRWRNRLDWIIDHLVEKRPEKLPLSIRYILRLGLYQLLFLERIPPFAAVHETVELAKRFGHRGTANLVNGVLREAYRQRSDLPYPPWDRDPIGYLTVVESHPRWMVERWVATWGVERARQICEANNRRPPLTLRTNTLRTTRTALLQLLQEAGIAATPSPLLPESIRLLEHPGLLTSLPGYSQGWFQVQDEGAMLVSYLLAPYPGNCLLDACAAPGGKTTHCAALSQDQGIIIALDRSRKRLYRLQENCRRLGIRSIHRTGGCRSPPFRSSL